MMSHIKRMGCPVTLRTNDCQSLNLLFVCSSVCRRLLLIVLVKKVKKVPVGFLCPKVKNRTRHGTSAMRVDKSFRTMGFRVGCDGVLSLKTFVHVSRKDLFYVCSVRGSDSTLRMFICSCMYI